MAVAVIAIGLAPGAFGIAARNAVEGVGSDGGEENGGLGRVWEVVCL